MKIRDIPEEKRPRERLLKEGAGALSNEELLAVILGRGTRKEDVISIARRLITQYGNISQYSAMSVKEVMEAFSIPKIHAMQVIAVMELGKRIFGHFKDVILNSPEGVFKYAQDMAYLKKEIVRGLYLDARGRLIHDEVISMGSLTETTIHPREVLKPAIVHSAYSFILVHNHPSGDPQPSAADIEFTTKIRDASCIMDIKFLDHIIIGKGTYKSLLKNGLNKKKSRL